jgi:hypothetical protein
MAAGICDKVLKRRDYSSVVDEDEWRQRGPPSESPSYRHSRGFRGSNCFGNFVQVRLFKMSCAVFLLSQDYCRACRTTPGLE